MKNTTYVFRFDYGESLIDALLEKLEKLHITSASLSGIGGLTEVELAFYDLQKKHYDTKKIVKPLELVNLSGTVALDQDNKTRIHAHAVVSDENFQAFGGHLKSARVNATCEITVTCLDHQLTRHHNEETGLFVLNNDDTLATHQ